MFGVAPVVVGVAAEAPDGADRVARDHRVYGDEKGDQNGAGPGHVGRMVPGS